MSILAGLIVKKINDMFPPAPKQQRSAEYIISKQEYLKTKRADIQMLTMEVKAQFTENMRHRKLKAWHIKMIRDYLKENVKAIPPIKYKNDSHFIHTALNSGAIKAEQLIYVKNMLR